MVLGGVRNADGILFYTTIYTESLSVVNYMYTTNVGLKYQVRISHILFKHYYNAYNASLHEGIVSRSPAELRMSYSTTTGMICEYYN